LIVDDGRAGRNARLSPFRGRLPRFETIVKKNSANPNSRSGICNPRALLAFALCSIGVCLAMLSLAEQATGNWVVVPSPDADATQSNTLVAVTCVSDSDCWAVGDYASLSCVLFACTSTSQTLIEHWDGTTWGIVASPNPTGATNSYLTDATCVSSSDCWAGGYSFTGAAGPYQTLIEHWDGTSWAIVSSPNSVTVPNNVLNAVTCVSTSDCWAVGYSTPVRNVSGTANQTLAEHWDGTSWAIITTPSNTSTTQSDVLSGVTCTSASDCWAVGLDYDSNRNTTLTLIERWDGSSWAIIPSANNLPQQFNVLYSVTCVSASDCWAVGYFSTGVGILQTLIERWDGAMWTIVPSPNSSATDINVLYEVTCLSESDCWAVGYYWPDHFRTLSEHWDGTAWAIVPTPNPTATSRNVLYGLSCLSTSNCWAAGYYWDDNSVAHTLTEHYIAPPPVQLNAVVSRKTHDSAGTFDIDLPLTGSPGIECRSGGANGDHTLVFSFLNTLNASNPVRGITATATTSSTTQTVTASGNIGTDTHEYFVNLSGVPNASHLSVTLNGVTDSANSFGDVSARMDVLLGDVNSSGRTDAGDVTAVRNQTVSIPDQQTFRFDVNTSGRIDSGDVTVTRNATVTVLPP
jgi:hypothetical protein